MVAELDSHLAADVGSVHIDEEAGGGMWQLITWAELPWAG